jgi:hypothetical protein
MRRALRVLEVLFVLGCVLGLLFAVITVAGVGTDATVNSSYPGAYPVCGDSGGYPASTSYPGYPGYPIDCDLYIPIAVKSPP